MTTTCCACGNDDGHHHVCTDCLTTIAPVPQWSAQGHDRSSLDIDSSATAADDR